MPLQKSKWFFLLLVLIAPKVALTDDKAVAIFGNFLTDYNKQVQKYLAKSPNEWDAVTVPQMIHFYDRMMEETVRSSEPKFPKDAKEFCSGGMQTFTDEADLIKKAAAVTDDEPITVFKAEKSPIYVITFKSEALQGAAMERISTFVESVGGKIAKEKYPHGKPADGHDYRLLDVARYYNEVEKQGVKLNSIELHLQNAFINAGLISKTFDERTKKYVFGSDKTSAVVSVGDSHYAPAIAHELNHAIYFTNPNYRNRVADFYEHKLDPKEKKLVDLVMGVMAKNGYYNFKGDHELFLTEFAAYFRDPPAMWKTIYFEFEGDIAKGKKQLAEIMKISAKLKAIEQPNDLVYSSSGPHTSDTEPAAR